MNTGVTMHRLLLLIILLAVALIPLWPNWLVQDLPMTHEGFRYGVLADLFAEAQQAGVFYPRWLPSLNGAWGYPTFVFYQPGYFFVAALFSSLTDDFLLRQLLALSLIALVGGMGMYRLARCWLSPLLSVAAVAVFQLAPYSHANLYLRGDLSEWMTLQWTPWPIFFLKRYLDSCAEGNVRNRCFAWLGMALSSALIAYTHPIAVIFLPIVLTLLAGFALLTSSAFSLKAKFSTLLGTVSALLAGLAMSSPYWASVALMKRFVNAEFAAEGFYSAVSNAAGLKTLLIGSFLSPTSASFNDSEFLGLPFVLLALLGAWRGRRVPLVLASATVYVLLILGMTATGKWLWTLPPFSLLQFPWRLATFAPVLQTVCIFGLLLNPSGLPRLKRHHFSLLVLGTVIGLAAYSPFRQGFVPISQVVPPEVFSVEDFACMRASQRIVSGAGGTQDSQEWLPLDLKTGKHYLPLPARGEALDASCHQQFMRFWVWWSGYNPAIVVSKPDALAPRPWVEFSSGHWSAVPDSEHSPFRLTYRLEGEGPGEVVINQIYLPGWRVLIDGKEVPRKVLEEALLADGRMRLPIRQGNRSLTAWYAGPLHQEARDLLILVLIGGSLVYWWRRLRAG